MSYRTEIDGLRAIAVTFVLLFHFFPKQVPLGYLGVDLFFVISGYVITWQIQAQLREGRFRFADFYARRIKRILPLCFVVIAVTVTAGRFLLLAPDFDRLVNSAIATASFWANVHFWLDGGYFGGTDKLKPLLHMWSLSVEEQFYLIYPFVAWLLLSVLRLRLAAAALAIAALTVASFWAWSHLIANGGATMSFFLMPTRAWQLGLGALAALAVAGGAARPSRAVAAACLALLLAAFFVSPRIWSGEIVVACATAVFLIGSAGLGAAVRPLSVTPLRWAGLRSFSLYLWHWPIAAFMDYAYLEATPLWARLAGIALCVALSEASYRLVETPFRRSFDLRKSVGLIAASCAVVAAVAGQAALQHTPRDMAARLAAQVQTNFGCSHGDFISYGASRACILDPLAPEGNVAILGNSHAQMYAEAISARFRDDPAGVILVPLNGCPPMVTLNLSPRCLAEARVNLNEVLSDSSVDTVIVGTTYGANSFVAADGTVVAGTDIEAVEAALLNLVDRISDTGRTVYVIGPVLRPGFDLPGELSRKLRFGWITEDEVRPLLSAPRRSFNDRYGPLIASLSERLGDRLLLPHERLCDSEICRFADAGGSFFADSNHLGRYGVATVASVFDEL